MTVHRSPVPYLLLAALLLGGCAGAAPKSESQSPSGGGTATTAPGATVKISGTDFKLAPAVVQVKKPGMVRFELDNAGQTVHALEIEGPKDEVKTKEIGPGSSATVTADLSKPGKYTMYCPVDDHKGLGMTGEIVVAGGGSGAKKSGEQGGGEGREKGGGGSY